jgi:glutamate racemase
VPIIEAGEASSPGADYFVKKRIDQLMALDPLIDTIILGCTHYPILYPVIKEHARSGVSIICQGEYVARSLCDYLSRHPEMDMRCSKNGHIRYLTTENAEKFSEKAAIFLNEKIEVEHISLG